MEAGAYRETHKGEGEREERKEGERRSEGGEVRVSLERESRLFMIKYLRPTD